MTPSEEAERTSIQDIANKLSITQFDFLESASAIYFLASRHLRGFSFRQLQAASVYASCRFHGVPRTLKEVSVASGLRAAEIARCYRKIVVDGNLVMPVQDPIAFVPGIASKAGLESDIQQRAVKILLAARSINTGKAPSVLAAAALCAACWELRPAGSNLGAGMCATQKSIAGAAGVSELAVRTRLRAIRSVLNPSR